ncbi:MAG: polyphosphate kinase [Rhodothermaceae bacterium]|nr:polyphosphate kinase [Rhodothermaceae bacterium]
MLEIIPLDYSLSAEEFDAQKKALRTRLAALQRASVEAELSVLVVFEGWDAAGKGSTIHRLTERLDPRGFSVHPIRAARPFEQDRPWMWRFWRTIPPHGRWAFYDRSWYGRVLVERMDRLVPEPTWQRGYDEIVQFEQMLTDDGALLVKFFLHIGPEEQQRRLTALAADPVTAWRVSPEDWQNHRRYALWQHVYDEMLERTGVPHAPWTVVPATCPRYAVHTVFQTLITALEMRLDTA